MEPLKVEQPAANKLVFRGDLTRDTVMPVWTQQSEHIRHLSEKTIHLDMGAVQQVDTAGLAFVIELAKLCQQLKVTLALHNTPEGLVNLAKLSNVESILPFH